jgi:AraC-like DNA-binding protein
MLHCKTAGLLVILRQSAKRSAIKESGVGLPEGQHRVGALVELPQVLRNLGADPSTVIAETGIDPDILRNPENALSFVQLGKLLRAGVAATNCQHLGLLVGQQSGMDCVGLVGRLMQNAPTLRDAILDLCVHQQRYIRGAVTYLVVQDRVAFWGYAVYLPGIEAIEQISDGAVAVGFNMMKELVGLGPSEILTSRPAPTDIAPYRSFFGSTPRFDREQHSLVFPERLLTLPVRGADPALRTILEKSVAEYWAVKEPSITDQVIRILRPRVIFSNASLEEIAHTLEMHPRTLNRRLETEGTTFRKLLNEARFEAARQLLVGTRIQVTNIALALGYSDTSSFSHAFQRWSGATPSGWRANL